MKNIFHKILITILLISVLLGISLVISDFSFEIDEKIFFTSFVAFMFSLQGLCCYTVYDKKYKKPFSIAGMTTCILGFMLSLIIVWPIFNLGFLEEVKYRLILISLVVSLSFAHLSLVLLIDAKNKPTKLIQLITIVLSVIMDAVIIMSIITIYPHFLDFKILAVLIILGTTATSVLNKLTATPNKNTPTQTNHQN